MDKIEIKKLVFKFLEKEPSYVGNASGLYWESDKYMIQLLPNRDSDNYGIIVYARTKTNKEVKVLESMVELEEPDFLALKLAILKYKQSYQNKLFNDLISDNSSDPMDELLEDPKDE